MILAIFRSLPFSLSYTAFSKNTKTTLILARIGEKYFQLAISLNINGQSIFLSLKKGPFFAFLVLEMMLDARSLLLDARIDTVTDARAQLDARNVMLKLARYSKN